MQDDDFKTKLKILGDNVKKLRTEKNITLKALSIKSGISIKYLKIIEDG